MVVSPVFMGAEPNVIDEGPHAGLRLFDDQEQQGLEFMRSLPGELQQKAQIYKLMHDPAMPKGRWHPPTNDTLEAHFRTIA